MLSGMLLTFLQLLRPLLHVIVIVFAYSAMYRLRGYTDLIPFVQLRIPLMDLHETMWFALFSAWLFVILWLMMGIYTLFRPTSSSYGSFFQTRLLRVMLSGFVAWIWFGYIFASGISRFVVIFASVGSLFAASLVDLWRYRWYRRHLRRSPYRLMIIGDQPAYTDKIIEQLWRDGEYEILSQTTEEFAITDLERYEGILLLDTRDHTDLQLLIDRCRIGGKDLFHLPESHFLDNILTRPTRLGPLMTMAYVSSPLSGRRRVYKRSFDVVIAACSLIVLSPLYLLLMILIKFDSPGPILYMQTRIGKNKQPFRFIKFRSMYTHLSTGEGYGGATARNYERELELSDANIRKGQLMKIQDDPRVTRLGKFLRKYSLDEFPSLRCVLVGDMSLVWPRPHLPHEVAKYDPWHERLFAVKPGITGYAQLYGRDKVPFDEEARLDLRYIQHRSVRLDLYVLFATVKVLFSGK